MQHVSDSDLAVKGVSELDRRDALDRLRHGLLFYLRVLSSDDPKQEEYERHHRHHECDRGQRPASVKLVLPVAFRQLGLERDTEVFRDLLARDCHSVIGILRLESDLVVYVLNAELAGIAMHVIEWEVLRKADADVDFAYRLLPLRQKHVEVEHVFCSIPVFILADPVFDGVFMGSLGQFIGFGYRYLARFRSLLCLVGYVFHLDALYTESAAWDRELHLV